MDTFASITNILEEILDLEPGTVTPETYIMRELDAESIDLLEIGVAMEQRFRIPVVDDKLFLKSLRMTLASAETRGITHEVALTQAYPHLTAERLSEILCDLEAGPVLKMQDLVAYATHHLQSRSA